MQPTAYDIATRVLARRQALAQDERALEQTAARVGLTVPLLATLVSIEPSPRPLGQIAEELGIAPSYITRLADRLTELELATRVDSPEDRRVTCLALLPGGQALIEQIKVQPISEEVTPNGGTDPG